MGDVNAYLILGEPLTLLDSGPSTEEAWAALGAGVEAAGCRLERVRRLLLTHPHPDHAGLAGRVQAVSGCAVLAHPVDHGRLLGDEVEWRRIVAFHAEVARRAGAPPEVVGRLEGDLGRIPGYVTAPSAVEALDEGDGVVFDDGRLEVLHTPGHARGALCFWDFGGRVLFSGDSLLPHISSNAILEPDRDGFRQRSLLLYRETLRRLAALEPSVVLPGHGEPMGDPGELIHRRMALYDARAARIRSLVEEGLHRPWEIAVRLFPQAGRGFAQLALSEVVGHLDLLAERGQVRFEGVEGPWEVRLD